jgi:small subunit ribosomal protein S6
MSRKYQGLIVLNTKSLDGSIEDLISSVSKELESEGAKVSNIDDLGRRQFAYDPHKLGSGQYVSYSFEGGSDLIPKIQGRLRLNGRVHLQHFQRVG